MTKAKGVSCFEEDARARLKLQNLMRDYQQLQKNVDAMKRNLTAANKRKMVVAAEVRFLRKRYKHLVNGSTPSLSLSEQMNERFPSVRKDGTESVRSFKKQVPPLVNPHHKEALQGRKKAAGQLSLKNKLGADKKRKAGKLVPEYTNTSGMDSMRNGNEHFEGRSEDLLPNRGAPLFDLNEISVGDEDIQSNVEPVKTMEAGIMSSPGDNNLQNDLKLILCRNAGEGSSSRVAKRKISWQDPVAVRV